MCYKCIGLYSNKLWVWMVTCSCPNSIYIKCCKIRPLGILYIGISLGLEWEIPIHMVICCSGEKELYIISCIRITQCTYNMIDSRVYCRKIYRYSILRTICGKSRCGYSGSREKKKKRNGRKKYFSYGRNTHDKISVNKYFWVVKNQNPQV